MSLSAADRQAVEQFTESRVRQALDLDHAKRVEKFEKNWQNQVRVIKQLSSKPTRAMFDQLRKNHGLKKEDVEHIWLQIPKPAIATAAAPVSAAEVEIVDDQEARAVKMLMAQRKFQTEKKSYMFINNLASDLLLQPSDAAIYIIEKLSQQPSAGERMDETLVKEALAKLNLRVKPTFPFTKAHLEQHADKLGASVNEVARMVMEGKEDVMAKALQLLLDNKKATSEEKAKRLIGNAAVDLGISKEDVAELLLDNAEKKHDPKRLYESELTMIAQAKDRLSSHRKSTRMIQEYAKLLHMTQGEIANLFLKKYPPPSVEELGERQGEGVSEHKEEESKYPTPVFEEESEKPAQQAGLEVVESDELRGIQEQNKLLQSDLLYIDNYLTELGIPDTYGDDVAARFDALMTEVAQWAKLTGYSDTYMDFTIDTTPLKYITEWIKNANSAITAKATIEDKVRELRSVMQESEKRRSESKLISELQEQLRTREAEMKNLVSQTQEQVESLRRSLELRNAELAAAAKESSDLARRLQETDCAEQVVELQQTIEEQERNLQQAATYGVQLSEEVDKVKALLSQCEVKLRDERQRSLEVENDEVANLRAERDQLLEEISNTRETINKNNTELNNLYNRSSDILGQSLETEAKFSKSEAERVACEEKHTKCLSDVAQLQQRQAELYKKLDEKQDELQSTVRGINLAHEKTLRDATEDLEKQLQDMSSKWLEANVESMSLAQKLEAQDRDAAEMKKELASVKDELDVLRSQEADYKKTEVAARTLRRRMEEIAAEKEELGAAVGRLQQNVSEEKAISEETRSRARKLQQEKEDLEKKVMMELQEAKGVINTQEQRLQEETRQLRELESRYAQQTSSMQTRLNQMLEQGTKELEEERQRSRQLLATIQEMDRLRQQEAATHGEVEKQMATIQKLTKNVADCEDSRKKFKTVVAKLVESIKKLGNLRKNAQDQVKECRTQLQLQEQETQLARSKAEEREKDAELLQEQLGRQRQTLAELQTRLKQSSELLEQKQVDMQEMQMLLQQKARELEELRKLQEEAASQEELLAVQEAERRCQQDVQRLMKDMEDVRQHALQVENQRQMALEDFENYQQQVLAENQRMQQQIESMTTSSQEGQRTFRELQDQLLLSKAQVEALESWRTVQQDKTRMDLEQQLLRIEELEQRLLLSNAQKEELEKWRALQQEKARVDLEREGLRMMELETQMEQMRVHNQTLIATVEAMEKLQSQQLKRVKQELEQSIRKLTSQNNDCESHKKKLQEIIKGLVGNIKQLSELKKQAVAQKKKCDAEQRECTKQLRIARVRLEDDVKWHNQLVERVRQALIGFRDPALPDDLHDMFDRQRQQLIAAEAQVRQLQQELAAPKSTEVNEQFDFVRNVCEQRLVENKQLQDRIAELTQITDMQLASLEDQSQRFEEYQARSEETLSQTRAQMENLTQQLQQSNMNGEECQKNLGEINQRLARLAEEKRMADEECQEQLRRLRDTLTREADLRMEELNARLQGEESRLQRRSEQQQARRVSEAEQQTEELAGRMEEVMEAFEIAAQDDNGANSPRNFKRLSGAVKSLRTNIKKIAASLKAALAKGENCEAELDAYREQVGRLTDLLETKERVNGELRRAADAEVERLSQAQQQTTTELRKALDELRQRDQAIQELAGEIQQLHAEVETEREQGAQRNVQDDLHATELRKALDELRQRDQAIQELAGEIQQLHAEVETEREQGAQRNVQDDLHATELQKALDELRQRDQAIQELASEIQQLHEQVEAEREQGAQRIVPDELHAREFMALQDVVERGQRIVFVPGPCVQRASL